MLVNMLSSRTMNFAPSPGLSLPCDSHLPRKNTPRRCGVLFGTPPAQPQFKTGALRNKQRKKTHNTTQTEQIKPKTRQEGKIGQR